MAGQSHSSRIHQRARLDGELGGETSHRLLDALMVKFWQRRKPDRESAQISTSVFVFQKFFYSSGIKFNVISQKDPRLTGKILQDLRSGTVQVDQRSKPFAVFLFEGVPPQTGLHIFGLDIFGQLIVGKPGNVLGVEPRELFWIEYRVRLRDAL